MSLGSNAKVKNKPNKLFDFDIGPDDRFPTNFVTLGSKVEIYFEGKQTIAGNHKISFGAYYTTRARFPQNPCLGHISGGVNGMISNGSTSESKYIL